jgi:hypothetical protein
LAFASVVALMHGLHESNHSATGADRHACLLCSLASGDVAAAQCVLILTLFPLSFLFLLATKGIFSPDRFHGLLPFGRAPPRV